MYHKFYLHFSSSQITFYPIRRCFLCWLKGTLKQTVLQLLLHCSLSSSTVSRPPFLWLYFFPTAGWSIISYTICLSLPPLPASTSHLQAGREPQCLTYIVQMLCFCTRTGISDWVFMSPTLNLLILSKHFTTMSGKKKKRQSSYLCMREPTLILMAKHIYCWERPLNYAAAVFPVSYTLSNYRLEEQNRS